MKIAFFGTPEFAIPTLEALALIPNIEIVQVITQPDKKTGRKQLLTPPPVKEAAIKLNLKISQPADKTELLETLDFEADFFVIIAYGMILPQAALKIPKFGAINIHASLLPKYRGASPIQEALLNGDPETGVSVMKIDNKLDHGPIYALKRTEIAQSDTLESLTKKLALSGAHLLPPILKDIYQGELRPIPQNEAKATHCKKIKKENGIIDFTKSAKEIFNMIRAYTPWPSTFTEFNNKKLKITEATYENNETKKTPGTFYVENNTLKIATGSGILIPKKLQPEGKTEITYKDFINSNQALLSQ